MKRKLRAALISLVDALAELPIEQLAELFQHGNLMAEINCLLEERHEGWDEGLDAVWDAQDKARRSASARKAAATRRARAALT
jgi:hypothetical protein